MTIFSSAARDLKSLRDSLCYLTHHALFAETPEERQEAHKKAVALNDELKAKFTEIWQEAGKITDFVRSPGAGNLLLTLEQLLNVMEPAVKMQQGSAASDRAYTITSSRPDVTPTLPVQEVA